MKYYGYRRVQRGPVENDITTIIIQPLNARAACQQAIIMHWESYCAKNKECMGVHEESGRFIPVHFHTRSFSYPCIFIPVRCTRASAQGVHVWGVWGVCVCVCVCGHSCDQCGNYRTPVVMHVCIRRQSC